MEEKGKLIAAVIAGVLVTGCSSSPPTGSGPVGAPDVVPGHSLVLVTLVLYQLVLIGIGLGSLTTSLRVIVGIERTWLGGNK